MDDNKKELPKWNEMSIVNKIVFVVSILLWILIAVLNGIYFIKGDLNPTMFNIILPLTALAAFMDAYVCRAKKDVMIFCAICGGFLLIMSIIFIVLF